MNRISSLILSTIAAAALSACGGGGGGGDTSATATPAAVKYTQADIEATAHLGVLTISLTGMAGTDLVALLGGVAESFALDTGGSRVVAQSICSSGTATATFTKSGIRAGLAVGDQVSTVYTQCRLLDTSVTLNGTVRMTAQSDVSTLSATDYSVSYGIATTDLSVAINGSTRKYSGALNAQSSVVGANSFSNRFTVPAGQIFTITTTATTGTQSMFVGYDSGATFVATDSISPNAATRKLDGRVSLAIPSATMSLLIATPTALSGTTSSANVFTASSGVVETTATAQNMATSATISGVNATVSGDSDGNGSLDLVFTTTASALDSL